jgi:preprotein translocase SecF subunit
MMRFVGDTNIDFLSKTKVMVTGTMLAIVAGVSLFAVLPTHDKLGIEFIGGNTMTIVTAKPETKDAVTTAVHSIDETFAEAVVQEIKSSAADGGFRQFRLEFKSGSDSDSADANTYRAAVQRALGDMLSSGPIEVTNNVGEVRGSLTFEQQHPVPDINATLEGIGLTEDSVQEAAATSGVTFEFNARAAATADNTTLYGDIEDTFADERDSAGAPFSWERPIPQSESVGPQVVQELRDKAIFAIMLSLFAVVMYIRVRFSEYSYGIAAVAALTHDVLFTIGALAVAIKWDLVEAEINLTMIAAFLTIIGYSLNDTIVIFDRIRENLPKYKRPLKEIINLSVNQTLARTLLTSGTTMLAVIVMFVFNVGTRNALESFGFAMMIGIVAGTFSTIYIANPVLLKLETRRLAKGGAPVSAPAPIPAGDMP